MARVRVEMSTPGSIALLNSEGVQQDLLRRAERIKASADSMGSGEYVADVRPGKTRAHARVKTAGTWRDYYSNRKHNSLLKSLDAGGGS